MRTVRLISMICGWSCVIVLTAGRGPIITGSITGRQNATPEIQDMVDSVKTQAEFLIGRSFPEFQAIAYRQASASTNIYFVKVHVGSNKYIHLRINQPQNGAPALEDYRVNMRRFSIIQYIAIIPAEHHATFQ